MGNGIRIKCLSCGYEWDHLSGIGMFGQRAENAEDTAKVLTPSGRKVTILRCPKCGHVEIEKNLMILWD